MTREMPALSMRAAFVPSSLDAEKRTVQLTWTTGARVMRGIWDRYWEELSLDPKHVRMERLNAGAPLLDSHNADGIRSVIGVVESAQLQRTKGVATVRFDSGAEGAEAFRKVQEGILRNVSVGYRVHKMEKIEDAADKVPVFRVVDWEPHELSMVPIGADADAGVRSADSERNPCVFVTRNKETKMHDRDDDDDNGTTAAPAAVSGESLAVAHTRKAAAARIEDAAVRAATEQAAAEKARAEERLRVAEITTLGKRFKMPESWVSDMVAIGAPVEEVRKAILDIGVRSDDDFNPSAGAHISAGEDERDKFIRGASASFFARSSIRKTLEQAKQKDPDSFRDVSFDAGEFRGMSPMDLARKCLERQRVNTRGMSRMQLVGEAFTRSGNYQTAGDFPILLENVLGKVLLGAYAIQPNTWERICKVDTVSDFRTSNRYRTGSLPGLDVIAEHGEYTSGVVPDGSKYPVSTARRGKMFSLSRETIVNDDMGALLDMATKLGQAAQRSIENAVYAMITANAGLGPTQSDAQPFFHSANRANINSTGSVLSVAGIEADAAIMAAQRDPNGLDYIDLQPAVLLVPRALLGTGKEINDAQWDFDNAGSNSSGKFMRPNKVRGLFRDVVGTPRLSGTRRYIIADPLDWIVVAFLDDFGRGPVMESRDGWRIDGVEWKVTVYAGVQMGDPKAAVTNAGTS